MLALPAPKFAALQGNLPATPGLTTGASSSGKTVTASPTIHAKGAWVELIAATTYETHLITVGVAGTNVAATRTDFLVDIGVGAAGSETVLIPNLLAGFCGVQKDTGLRTYTFPLHIPEGTRLSARGQALIASDVCEVNVFLHGGPSGLAWPIYDGCDAIGIATSTSSGTYITSGASGTEGAWTSVGGVTARPYDALMFGVGGVNNTVITSLAYHFEIGYSSTTLAEYLVFTGTAEVAFRYPDTWFGASIPASTQLQVRGEASAAGPQTVDVALYGLY